jgi:tetratricopeptide (TPR) repeat protein
MVTTDGYSFSFSRSDGRMRAAAINILLLFVFLAFPAQAQAEQISPDSANVLVRAAVASYEQGSIETSVRLFQEALAFIRSSGGDPQREGLILNNIASAYRDLGRVDSALVYSAQSLAVFRAVGDRSGEGIALNNTGSVHLMVGRADSALVYFAQARAVTREVGDRYGEARVLNNLGSVFQDLARADSALVYYRRALIVSRQLRDPRAESITLNNIGSVYRDLNRADSALIYYGAALSIARMIEDRRGEVTTLNNIASIHLVTGQTDSAQVYLERAFAEMSEGVPRRGEGEARMGTERSLPLFHFAGDRRGEGSLLVRRAAASAEGGPAGSRTAASLWSRAGNAHAQTGFPSRAAAAWDTASRAYERIGERDSALAYAGRALEVRDRTAAARVDSLLSASPLIRPTLGLPGEAQFVQAVRDLLADVRGRPTPEGEVPSTEAAHAVLDALNAGRETLIVVKTTYPAFVFGFRRYALRDSDDPETWATSTAATSFHASRQWYQFQYVDPRTGRIVQFFSDCTDSPCDVQIPLPASPVRH